MRRILVTGFAPAPGASSPDFFDLQTSDSRLIWNRHPGWSPPVTADEADDSYCALGAGRSVPRHSPPPPSLGALIPSLCVSAYTAIFTFVNIFLLRPLAYKDEYSLFCIFVFI